MGIKKENVYDAVMVRKLMPPEVEDVAVKVIPSIVLSLAAYVSKVEVDAVGLTMA